jgi:DNA-binding CsgD family transcriptional regulator
MPAAAQPDLLAAARLVRALQDADSLAAVRGAVLADLPRLVHCGRVGLDLPPDGPTVRLTLDPGDRELEAAERALLELLRPHLLIAVRRVRRAEQLRGLHLTPREHAVLALVADGAPNVTIARELRMRPRTVEKHLEHAYAKLGVGSRTAAVAVLRAITH